MLLSFDCLILVWENENETSYFCRGSEKKEKAEINWGEDILGVRKCVVRWILINRKQGYENKLSLLFQQGKM